MSTVTIVDLNDDVLSMIFELCPIEDLLKLVLLCKRFYAILCQQGTFRRKTKDLLIVGHRNHGSIAYERNVRPMSFYKRAKLYSNWSKGRYDEQIRFHGREFCPSSIILEKELLYRSCVGQVQMFRRTKDEHIIETVPMTTFGAVTDAAITSMVKTNDTLVISRTNGRVKIIMLNDMNDSNEINVSGDTLLGSPVSATDMVGDLFVTTTMAQTSLWRKNVELDTPYLDLVHHMDSGIKSLRFSPTADCLALGKFRARDSEGRKCALRLVDVETNVQTISESAVGSIYDIQWKDNNTILTGSYDTRLRLFDRRTSRDECYWEDPFDLSVYCVSYDGSNAVLCGMQYHCRVNLYDLRVPNKTIQMYFPANRLRGSRCSDLANSPAYEVAYDQSQLFISTDRNLRILNFDADWAALKDYSNMFPRSICG